MRTWNMLLNDECANLRVPGPLRKNPTWLETWVDFRNYFSLEGFSDPKTGSWSWSSRSDDNRYWVEITWYGEDAPYTKVYDFGNIEEAVTMPGNWIFV